MRILITGICGFVGSTLAHGLTDAGGGHELIGLDNLVRAGSEGNRRELARRGIRIVHGDVRAASDFESLPAVDWVLDAAANPSVLAGTDGRTSSRQLLEHNLGGTINMLEYCKRSGAGFILLSTSRVYSIDALRAIHVEARNGAFVPMEDASQPPGISADGVSEDFASDPPLSLYGTSKRTSELLALEYGASFGFPVWINRCGVMAGAGQFGHAEQGIFSFWIHSWAARRPLKYLGFAGSGHQVRDCLHPADLLPLLERQMAAGNGENRTRIVNIGGGMDSAMSLAQLSDWCAARFGPHEVEAVADERQYDIPWLVLDPRRAQDVWGWRPRTAREAVLNEIADFAEANPDWLARCAGA